MNLNPLSETEESIGKKMADAALLYIRISALAYLRKYMRYASAMNCLSED